MLNLSLLSQSKILLRQWLESPYVLEAFFGALVWCSGGYTGLPNASHHSRGHICPWFIPGTYRSGGGGSLGLTSSPRRDLHNSIVPYPGRGSLGGIFTLRPGHSRRRSYPRTRTGTVGGRGSDTQAPIPSDKAIIEVTRFAPSDLRAYEYASA